MKIRPSLLFAGLCLAVLPVVVVAQNSLKDPDAGAPLAEVEARLEEMAYDLLRNPSSSRKEITGNRFSQLLKTTLERPESINYPFSKLQSVSVVGPADQSFRVFTWYTAQMDSVSYQIVPKWAYDTTWAETNGVKTIFNITRYEAAKDTETVYKYSNFKYNGIIQRRYFPRTGAKGKRSKTAMPVVIVLNDRMNYSNEAEVSILNQDNWFGCLYYPAKHNDGNGILTFKGQTVQLDGMKGKMRKHNITYYVALGWNGHDDVSDYKLADVIGFEDKDSSKVIFGAPIFYFTNTPKYRVVFKYSDNSPFSLNQGYFVDTPGKNKVKALIYDHMQEPKNAKKNNHWSMGADGSYDALVYLNKVRELSKGFFHFMRNVAVYEPKLEQYDPAEVERQAQSAKQRLNQAGINTGSRVDPEQGNK